jgi:hypothetical protein
LSFDWRRKDATLYYCDIVGYFSAEVCTGLLLAKICAAPLCVTFCNARALLTGHCAPFGALALVEQKKSVGILA